MLGQAAFEYLVLFSIALTILSVLTYYAQEMTSNNMEEIAVSNAMIMVNKVAEAADIVYSQGSPSQITFSAYMPDNVKSIEFQNNTIKIEIDSGSGINDIFASSKAVMRGSITIDSGTKRVRVEAEGSYVNVTQV